MDRQIKLGVVPEGTKLAPKPKAIPEWESLSADQKRLYTKQVEVFAAYIDMMDYEIGRLIDAVDEIGQTENTMVIFVYGDNGTSAEGGANGMYSEMTYFNGVQETVPDMLKKIDKWGGPETYPHMAAGWAVMFDTPLQMDQTNGVRPWRNKSWDDHSLAERHQDKRRIENSIYSRNRCGTNHTGSRRST